MIEALDAAGLGDRVYLWSDDNLSNDYFWQYLNDAERTTVSEYPRYGKVCCFKGYDEESFSFNTLAAPELFENQFALMGRLLRDTGIDLYAYVTLTTPGEGSIPTGVRRFVDRLQLIHPLLPLRTVPLEIRMFTPVHGRMEDVHRRALKLQWDAVSVWQDELEHRFSTEERGREMWTVRLR